MARYPQRLVILAAMIVFGMCYYLVQNNSGQGRIYRSGVEFIDDITHMRLQSEDVRNKKYQAAVGQHAVVGDEGEEHRPQELDPCTAYNPISHGFIDLRALTPSHNDGKALGWTSKGYDSGHNFTVGICSNPFKKHHDRSGEIQDNVDFNDVGAYYMDSASNSYVSIGAFSTKPVFRGRKLSLTYENGSYCSNVFDKTTGQPLRKSSILTFTCDREMMAKASVSYIGSVNDCTYFFEVRSHHACPTAAKANNLAAIWIFMFILFAALLVYLSGGLFYRQMKAASKPNVALKPKADV